jgi:hypothetical protein
MDTSHILRLNGIIGDNDVIDAKALPQVKMPMGSFRCSGASISCEFFGPTEMRSRPFKRRPE